MKLPKTYHGKALPMIGCQRSYHPRAKIYFWEWTCGGGTTTFGMHGTVSEWKRYLETKLHDMGRKEFITLVTKRFTCTGAEQNEYLRKLPSQVKKLLHPST